MRIGVLGISYKSAEIQTLELISKACQKRLSKESPLAEQYRCVVLATCNRMEIYFSAENLAEAHSALLNVLREEVSIAFEHKLYSYFGCDCFSHLAQVACGLDSAILGESEIQRQVKVSYEQTLLHYSLPSSIHYLFQKCLKQGKEIRTHFTLAQNQSSIAKTLFQMSEHFLKEMQEIPLLFIGNSEINRKVIAFFKRKGVHNITLCTRSLHSAAELAAKEKIAVFPWDQLDRWREFPLVICGTNVPHFLLTAPSESMKTRLIFDLSVPRAVDPQLARHPNLVLMNMGDLIALIQKKQERNNLEINQAEMLILKNVQRYVDAFRAKEKRNDELLCVS